MATMVSTDVETETAAVKTALGNWIASVERKDMRLLPRTVVRDPDAVWIGAGAEEFLSGWEALEQAMQAQNAALNAIHITISDETIHISPEGRFAWATNRWNFTARLGDQIVALPLRCTWVLEKREAGWVIAHFHKSAGMSG